MLKLSLSKKEWDTELVEVSESKLPSSASGNDIEIREVSEVLEETDAKVVSRTSTTFEKSSIEKIKRQ